MNDPTQDEWKGARYIESPRPHVREFSVEDPATQFRRVFDLRGVRRATLRHAGLGIGYFYLNGHRVEDAVLPPGQGDYLKTVWYRCMDVTALLVDGENVLAAMVGNGFYNESIDEPFSPHLQSWRGNPKLMAHLAMETHDGQVHVVSDGRWTCFDGGPVRFNQVRNGEYYDARREDPTWNQVGYAEPNWGPVRVSSQKLGTLRPVACPPVREREVLRPVGVTRKGGAWVFHFERNISGYARVSVNQPPGTELTIRYGETLTEGRVDSSHLLGWSYKNSVFATDRLTCREGETRWSPKFAYHGFQYIEVEGLEGPPDPGTVEAVFISQDLPATSSFRCSNELVDWIFTAGIASSRCNFHHVPTDCPTREKAGWTNDGQASAKQFLLDFDSKAFLEKWHRDILDTQRADGAVACIAPCTEHYGFDWTAGPVSDGALIEIPYQIWKVHGDPGPLQKSLPAIEKYLAYLKGRVGTDGLLSFGLWDWAGPFDNYKIAAGCPTPQAFSDSYLYMKFLTMAQALGPNPAHEAQRLQMKKVFDRAFLGSNGRCNIPSQTAVSMLLCMGYPPGPLAGQLEELISARGGRLHVGMLGIQYLFEALSLCGKDDLAFRVLTARGYPSFSLWKDQGATTLWETWQCTASKNHHMYSCVLVYILERLLGIQYEKGNVRVGPRFPLGLDWAEGTVHGYGVSWKREGEGIHLTVKVPKGGSATGPVGTPGEKPLALGEGTHPFTIPNGSPAAVAPPMA